MQTPLTTLLGIKTPVVSGAMAGASGGLLAAEVTLGGGFGFLSAGYDSPEMLKREIALARERLATPVPHSLNLGIGFLAWQLDAHPARATELLDIALASGARALWLAFGNDIARWARYVRDNDPRAGTPDAVRLFIQVGTVEESLRARDEWHADVIVVQGIEAGGHGHGKDTGLPLLTLFPLVAAALAQSPQSQSPPLLAAGGLSTPAHLAALLALGADGIVLGTRFLATPEALYTAAQKDVIVRARSADSVRTMAFDAARGTTGWPAGVDGRAIRNATVDDFAANALSPADLRARFEEGVRAGDPERMLVWAGTGVGFVDRIMPARDIVRELHEGCVALLQRAAQAAGAL